MLYQLMIVNILIKASYLNCHWNHKLFLLISVLFVINFRINNNILYQLLIWSNSSHLKLVIMPIHYKSSVKIAILHVINYFLGVKISIISKKFIWGLKFIIPFLFYQKFFKFIEFFNRPIKIFDDRFIIY